MFDEGHLPPGAARWLLRRVAGGWPAPQSVAPCVRLGAVARWYRPGGSGAEHVRCGDRR